MNIYDKLVKVKRYTDKIGDVYGTEDFSVYLYSIVKMAKSKNIVELGSGLFTTTLWAALALEENQSGLIHTVDNGAEWNRMSSLIGTIPLQYKSDYYEFAQGMISEFQFQDRIKFYNGNIDDFKSDDDIDILFSDYSHGVYSIFNLIANYLHAMTDNSYIFIDSASTYYPSFLTLNTLIDSLNKKHIPSSLGELVHPDNIAKFTHKVNSSKFEITHIIENKNRNQNSVAQIKILPDDIMPQPRVNIRF